MQLNVIISFTGTFACYVREILRTRMALRLASYIFVGKGF
jgi:hypothetical protein